MGLTTWDIRFLELAKLVASWSKDPSTKVGAVIADSNNRIVSLGFNGFPRTVPDEREFMEKRDAKLKITLHAEVNAILFAKRHLDGMTIYVTCHPCAQCTSLIVQSGISRVVWISDPEFEGRWKDDVEVSRWIMETSKVEGVSVEPWLLSSH